MISVPRQELARLGLAGSPRMIVTDEDDHTFDWFCCGLAGGGDFFGRSTAVPQNAQAPWSPSMAIEAPHEGQ
jgi:hypothetical protein